MQIQENVLFFYNTGRQIFHKRNTINSDKIDLN